MLKNLITLIKYKILRFKIYKSRVNPKPDSFFSTTCVIEVKEKMKVQNTEGSLIHELIINEPGIKNVLFRISGSFLKNYGKAVVAFFINNQKSSSRYRVIPSCDKDFVIIFQECFEIKKPSKIKIRIGTSNDSTVFIAELNTKFIK